MYVGYHTLLFFSLVVPLSSLHSVSLHQCFSFLPWTYSYAFLLQLKAHPCCFSFASNPTIHPRTLQPSFPLLGSVINSPSVAVRVMFSDWLLFPLSLSFYVSLEYAMVVGRLPWVYGLYIMWFSKDREYPNYASWNSIGAIPSMYVYLYVCNFNYTITHPHTHTLSSSFQQQQWWKP